MSRRTETTHRYKGRTIPVRVGSRWRSNDPRDHGRTVEVTHIYPDGHVHAGKVLAANVDTGRETRIAVSSLGRDARTGFTAVDGEHPAATVTIPRATLERLEAAAADRDELLGHYSRALDDIHRMRAVLAAEARRIDADLDLKSFPKSRRPFAEAASDRLKASARGDVGQAYAHLKRPKDALQAIGAPTTLTRAAWEDAAGSKDSS